MIWELLRTLLLAGGLAYLGLALFALVMANRTVFPRPPVSYAASEAVKMLPVPETGDQIASVYLPLPTAEQVIFYHHGNYEDLGNLLPRLEALRALGFAVFAYDYPGYGLSTGHATEARVLAAARAAQTYVTGDLGYRPDQIIAYGRSLGGGPAVQLATETPLGGLVLESTFTSTFRVMTQVRLLPWDIFDNLGQIKAIQCPVLLLHGTLDATVPFFHGEKLLAAAPEPKAFLWIDGAGHNDLWEVGGPVVEEALVDFARRLP